MSLANPTHHQHQASYHTMANMLAAHDRDSASECQSPQPASVTSLTPVSTGSPGSLTKSRSSSAKPPNVFSNDGSFLDRIRRSIKEEEDKKKEQEALERKKHFADRFKQRKKRPLPTTKSSAGSTSTSQDAGSTSQDTTPEEEEASPSKKRKVSNADAAIKGTEEGGSKVQQKEEKEAVRSPQAKYHEAMDSYPSSLKDTGTGVRPLIK